MMKKGRMRMDGWIDGWLDRMSFGRELAKRLAESIVLGSKRPDSNTVHPVVPVCIQLLSLSESEWFTGDTPN